MKTHSLHLFAMLVATALFVLNPICAQQTPPDLKAAMQAKLDSYKARHPANAAPKNAINGSFRLELEEAEDLAMMMEVKSVEESLLMLAQVLKAALTRIDPSFDPNITHTVPLPKLPQGYKRDVNPILDPSRLKDATERSAYEKRLAEYLLQGEKIREQVHIRLVVSRIVRTFESRLSKQSAEMRRQIQGKLIKDLQGVKVPAEDEATLRKALKMTGASK